MTAPDESEAWGRVRVLATNITGFHELAETPEIIRDEVQRLHYEAQVYAGGVALARLLAQIMAEPYRD